MPIANTEDCYQASSHLLYVLAFTTMKDFTIINSDFNSNSIPQDLKPQLHFTTLLPRGITKEQRITKLNGLHKTTNLLIILFL